MEATTPTTPATLTTQFILDTFGPELEFHEAAREKLDKALDLAARRNLQENLLRNLAHLARLSRPGKPVRVFADFAPASFFFTTDGLVGGLLYYGPGDDGVDGPQFSCRLGDTREGWEIHT